MNVCLTWPLTVAAIETAAVIKSISQRGGV